MTHSEDRQPVDNRNFGNAAISKEQALNAGGQYCMGNVILRHTPKTPT